MSMDSNDKIIVYVDSDIKGLIPGFLDNRKKDITSIIDALTENDYEAIRIIGHSLKGSGGGYGFDNISDIGRLLEQGAKTRNAIEIRKCVERLSEYLERVKVVYE
ncbi:MAG: Hpt domain-containing protein [Candidatus Scalindua sp.]|nr:Hpt domain-containing protein [Candidatus Scalindua sp.]